VASLHEGDFILSPGSAAASVPLVEQRVAHDAEGALGWHGGLIHQLDVPVTHFAFDGF
jgi:hypothetical protein